ncbi:exonuclease SbcCD subunit D [Nocardioides insulae]|uniref:exonuclease SbcCD subunit D n=1 Tax=Nocardioides insulae TaxID=394734 RepID=UPI0004105530|nr:exonuclease SbcCD subunit D [Nocardioides insulae]
MRILHTSDWHLGRSFHREGMLVHQAAFVDHLLDVVEQEQVDLVVLAGDVYDRALPPVDAVQLADEALARLAASRAQVVITSGNHDSARRLGFSSRLIDAAGVYIRADAGRVGRPVLLGDEHGPVAVHGLPYLDPDAVREPWQLPVRSHAAALGEAMRRVRADLAGRSGATRSVVLAHAFVAGQSAPEPSESERDISVGGVSIVPTTLFEGISYTALGHLHGRHTLTETVRYSGSPLAYSFSEADQRKGTWLVELGASGLTSAAFIEAPVPRPLARLRGELETLLTDPALGRHEQSWVQATLTDPVRPMQAMERLRRRFPHTLVLGFEATAPVIGRMPTLGHRVRDRDLVREFVTELRGTAPSAAEAALLDLAVDACCEDPDLDHLVSDDEPVAPLIVSGPAAAPEPGSTDSAPTARPQAEPSDALEGTGPTSPSEPSPAPVADRDSEEATAPGPVGPEPGPGSRGPDLERSPSPERDAVAPTRSDAADDYAETLF